MPRSTALRENRSLRSRTRRKAFSVSGPLRPEAAQTFTSAALWSETMSQITGKRRTARPGKRDVFLFASGGRSAEPSDEDEGNDESKAFGFAHRLHFLITPLACHDVLQARSEGGSILFKGLAKFLNIDLDVLL